MIWTFLDRYRDIGLLILRVGIGLAFIFFHGMGKLFDGPERWATLGERAQYVGIAFWPPFWGFMAGLAEFGGGLLLILGLFFRPALILMTCVMITAAAWHIGSGTGSPYHAIEMGILFVSLFLIGPGRYSLDHRLTRTRSSTIRGPRRAHRPV